MAVIKMSLGVLQYLRAAKADAAPISVQFLHGAARGLDLFVQEPAATETERSEIMDKLLGQFRRVKAEIQRMKPPTEEPPVVAPEPAVEPPPVEEPILEEMLEEEPALDELFVEEPLLEDGLEEEPTLVAPSEEEPALDELFVEEPLLEDGLEEEPTLVAPPEEEPLLEEPPEEEPTLEALTAEEPTLAAPPEEEPLLEELLEELVAEEPPEAEPTLEPLPEEEPVFEELFDEEPVLEPAVEPTEMAPPPQVAPADTPASLQPFIQEARALSGQLANALEVLDQETTTFFGRILKAMTGKPALEKLERHFDSVHKTVGARLTEAQELSGNLNAALSKLEQNLGQQQEETLAPEAQAAIDSQVKTIRSAVQSLTQVTSNLQHSLAGKGVVPKSSHEGIAFKDAQMETEEFALDSDDFMESLESEPVLDLVEEISPESPGITPDAQASIYLADVVNNTLGIPAEAVVNIFKVSKGKVKSLRKRGYVGLTD
jgi:hypothetical protein